MRAIWKGAVSFGLVNVPVRLFSATQEHDIRFHQVHREDGGRIRMKRICSIDGEEIPYDQIAKGYESPDGRLVILTDEDFASLPLATGREIEVVEFVPVEQVDPIPRPKRAAGESTRGSRCVAVAGKPTCDVGASRTGWPRADRRV